MYPHERSLVKRLNGKPFALLGVNSDRDREKIRETVKEKGLTWRSFWNGGSTSGPISTRWNVRGWPTIYVLDQDGVIRFKNVRGEAMDEAVDALLAKLDGGATRGRCRSNATVARRRDSNASTKRGKSRDAKENEKVT